MKPKKPYLFSVLFVLVSTFFCASAAWALPMFGDVQKNKEKEQKPSTSEEQRERSGGEESESEQEQRGNLSQGNRGILEEECIYRDKTKGDLTDETSARVLTLDDFTNSINNYPTAARLIIKDGAIQAEEADPNTAGKNRAENGVIIDAIKGIIRPIVPERVDNDLDHLLRYNNSSSVSIAIDPLSSERLEQILEKLDLFLKQLDVNVRAPDQNSYNLISNNIEERKNSTQTTSLQKGGSERLPISCVRLDGLRSFIEHSVFPLHPDPKVAEYHKKALETKNLSLALSWINVAHEAEKDFIFRMKAGCARALNQWNASFDGKTANEWDKLARHAQNSVDYIIEIIKADQASAASYYYMKAAEAQDELVEKAWVEAAKMIKAGDENAADCWLRTIKALLGDNKFSKSWDNLCRSVKQAIEYRGKAAKADQAGTKDAADCYRKASEAQDELSGTAWAKAAQFLQSEDRDAAICWIQMAKALAEGKFVPRGTPGECSAPYWDNDIENWNYRWPLDGTTPWEEVSSFISPAIRAKKLATQNEQSGNKEASHYWKKAAEALAKTQNQQLSQAWERAAKATKVRDRLVIDRWIKVAEDLAENKFSKNQNANVISSVEESIKYGEKAADAERQGNKEVAYCCKKAAEAYDLNDVNACVDGKTASEWKEAARCAQQASEHRTEAMVEDNKLRSLRPKNNNETTQQKCTREVTVQTPAQNRDNLVLDNRKEKDNLLQIASPQEDGSERLPKKLEEIPQLKAEQEPLQQLKAQVTEKTFLIDEQIKEAKQASCEGKGGKNACLWDRIVTKLEQAKESWHRAQETRTQGKLERSALWQQAAKDSEASVAGIKNVVLTYIAGNETEAKRLENTNWGAYYLSDALTWELKSKEALEKATQGEQPTSEESEESAFWEKRAKEYKKAADYERKAIEANSEKKESFFFIRNNSEEEHNSLFLAGRSVHATAEYQIKEAQARKAGKVTIASEYGKLAQRCESALGYYLKGATAYAAGKISEGNGFYHAAEKLEKAIKAEEAGKPAVAQKWREAAAMFERSVDPFLKAATAYATGKTSEWESWKNAGNGFKNAADKLGEAIKAEEAGKVSVAQKWREVAAMFERSVDPFLKAAEALSAGKTSEWESWENAGNGFKNAADKLGEAIKAEEAGKVSVAQKWREAAAMFERSVDPFLKAAQARAAEKTEEGASWNNAGPGFYNAGHGFCNAGHGFCNAADKLGKAIEAEEAGKLAVAQKWRDAAALDQRSIDPFLKAAQAFAAGKTDEETCWNNPGNSWTNAGHRFAQAAENLSNAIIEEKLGEAQQLCAEAQQEVENADKKLNALGKKIIKW